MVDNKRYNELIFFLKQTKIIRNQQDFVERIGSDKATVSQIVNNKISIPNKMFVEIGRVFPNISIEWLKNGEGEMLKSRADKVSNIENDTPNEIIYLPLLPISAQGGSLNDFVVSVKDTDCEKIISPIKGVDFAITVSGDSMAPEYPSGSQILIKKINEKAFIDWGKVYVLDTCNGSVIKILVPSEKEGYVKCLSINPAPKYAPFEVSFADINGIYRVMLCMSMK
jgi:phage repressor protein C with HTH and peptisase S24 domain